MSDLLISFLPRSVSHDWVHAETPEEISNCLDEIALAYQSMSSAERAACTGDIEKIIVTTMRDLICDAPDVVIHGLIVLDHVSRDHAKFFVSCLSTLFVRIKRYIIGKNETIRRHATRLAGSLTVHLPHQTMGPHLLTLLHDETVDRAITVKLAALSMLYSRARGYSSAYIQEFAKDALDTCVDHLDYNRLTLSVPPKSGGGDGWSAPDAAILDFIAVVIRVFVLDSLFSHSLLADSNANLFQKCCEQLPVALDDVLNQIMFSSSVAKEICWRAQANEYPTLQNDHIVASFTAHALSLPANTFHQNIEDDIDGEDPFDSNIAAASVADTQMCGSIIKRSQSVDSDPSPAKQRSPGKPSSPDSTGDCSLSTVDRDTQFAKKKSYSMDFDERVSPTQSHISSPLHRTPSGNFLATMRSQSKLDTVSDNASPNAFANREITSTLVENGSSASLFSPVHSPLSKTVSKSTSTFLNKDVTSMLVEVGSQPSSPSRLKGSGPLEDTARVDLTSEIINSSANEAKGVLLSDALVSGMTQSLSSNAISTIPYQPPPTSWGLGLAHATESGLDSKVCVSRSTAGVTTTSSMSSSTPGAAPSADQEDWQRLATPWLYFPASVNGEKGFMLSAGGEGTSGLHTPTRESPLDKSKLKSLKRPGRNFRSSNTAGANQPAKTEETLGETRAYTAGLLPGGGDEQLSQWRSTSTDACDLPLTRQTSSSFSGPFGEIGDAIKSINAMSVQFNENTTNYETPIKRKVKNNPTFGSSPPRHEVVELLPEIGSTTPSEKGSYTAQGKRVHLVTHPHEMENSSELSRASLVGIGGAKGLRLASGNEVNRKVNLGRTAISVAEIFDEDDLSLAHELTEQDLESCSVLGIPRPHHAGKPPSLNLNIEIENPSTVTNLNVSARSEFGPYIESPAIRKLKINSLSPKVRGQVGRRGSNRTVLPSPRIENELEPDAIAEPNHLPVIGGHAEFGVDSSGIPLHKPSDQFEYLASEDIQPLENPSKELAKVTRGLDTDEWPDIFHTINKMRQLALHHNGTVLNSTCLHPMVMGIIKQADNLRSAVCKNALLAVSDVFIGFGKAMDGETQNLIPMLLKRSVDSSAFLSGSANAALCAMIERVSVGRSLAPLMQFGADHKTAGIRGTTVNCISHLVSVRLDELKNPSCKDGLDSLRGRLGKFMSDPNPNVRAQTREIVRQLVTNGVLTRSQIEQCVAPNLVAKALQESSHGAPLMTPMSNYSSTVGERDLQVTTEVNVKCAAPTPQNSSHKNVGSPLNTVVKKRLSVVSKAREELRQGDCHDSDDHGTPRMEPVELGVSGLGSTRGSNAQHASKYSALQAAHANHQIDTIGDLVELPEAMKKLVSKNWSERNEAISHITDSIIENSTILSTAGKLEGLVDAILEKLEDGSIKVCIHALTSLSKIHHSLPEILPSMYSTVIPAFLTASSSANRQISTIGSEIFNTVVSKIPAMPLMQKLCTIAVHDKDRLRCSALRTITNYISKNDTTLDMHVLQRVIFPVICQTVCAGASKPEVRTAANDSLRALQRSCKEPVWKWTQNLQQQTEIRRLTGL